MKRIQRHPRRTKSNTNGKCASAGEGLRCSESSYLERGVDCARGATAKSLGLCVFTVGYFPYLYQGGVFVVCIRS
jgi:hypothetical protein